MKKTTIIAISLVLVIFLVGCNGNDAVAIDSDYEPDFDNGTASEAFENDSYSTEEEKEDDNHTPDESELNPNSEMTAEGRIDIYDLTENNADASFLDHMRYLFNELEEQCLPGHIICFDNGLCVYGRGEFDNFIVVDYRRTVGLTGFHFSGLDGTSNRDDVRRMFGGAWAEFSSREFGMDMQNPLIVYGYHFARFLFNRRGDLVGIHVFVPSVRPENNIIQPVDIQSWLGQELNDVRSLLGRQIGYTPFNIDPLYVFENGVSVSADGGMIRSVVVDYSRVENPNDFHFSGINGASTREDLLAILGKPSWGWDIDYYFYGDTDFFYYMDEHVSEYASRIARFRFDDNDNIVMIMSYWPV